MGMFDYVNYEASCWRCGEVLKCWQSKDADCEMKTVEVSEVNSFYESCKACGAWNEFERVFTPEFQRNEEIQIAWTTVDLRAAEPPAGKVTK